MSSGPNTILAAQPVTESRPRLKPAGPATGHVDGAWWPRTRDLAARAEQPRPGALTTSPDDRYGSLFLQPVYTPAPRTGDGTTPSRQRQPGAASTCAPDPSGRRARR